MSYEKVAVGGTFEFLHDGHKSILSKAFEIGDQVLIGIVSDKMELRKDSAGIQPLEDRMRELKNFLEKRDWLSRAELEVISDSIGPAADDEELEAIVVTEETYSKAEEINELRLKNGLDSLDIIKIPLILDNEGNPISSIKIRYEEIDEHGNVK